MFEDPPDDSSDDRNGRRHRSDRPLPELHKSDGGAVDKMIKDLRRLDGPMSASNATVPLEASEIGDTDERPNPRASFITLSGVSIVEIFPPTR